jgi:hypothetical protein
VVWRAVAVWSGGVAQAQAQIARNGAENGERTASSSCGVGVGVQIRMEAACTYVRRVWRRDDTKTSTGLVGECVRIAA